MKRISRLSLLLVCTFLMQSDYLFAKSNSLDYESQKNLGMSNEKTRAYEESDLINGDNMLRNNGIYNYPESIYEHYKGYEAGANQHSNLKDIKNASFDFDENAKKLAANNEVTLAEVSKREQEQEQKDNIKLLRGYCMLPNEVTVDKLASYAILNCDFMGLQSAQMAVTLTPDFYSSALIATPLWVRSGDDYTPVSQGVVMNGIRTSINVATTVNDYLIQKLVASLGVQTANIATRKSQQYLDAKIAYEQSNNGESNTSVVSNGTVVTSISSDGAIAPRHQDYVAGAIIELVSAIAKTAGNAYLDSIGYTFKIEKDTILFADLTIDKSVKGIRGVGFMPKNMVQVPPRPNTNDGTFISPSDAKNVPIDNTRYQQR